MDFRQHLMEEIVLGHYRSQEDTRLHSHLVGAHLLTLTSPAAREPFSGREKANLVFDAELAFDHPDWVMVDSGHPCLEVVRNYLRKDLKADPRLAEAHLPLHVSSSNRGAIPGLVLAGSREEVLHHTRYYDVFVLTYRVNCDGDYLIPIVVDNRGRAFAEEIVKNLPRLRLAAGLPAEELRQSMAHAARNIRNILKQGREVIEARVQTAAARQAEEVSQHLERDKQRVLEGFMAEAKDIPSHKKLELAGLAARRDRSLRDLEEKEKLSVRVGLFSILHLWLPVLNFTVVARGKRGRYEVKGIDYDGGTGTTKFETCPRCGNGRRFHLCEVGEHAACGESACGESKRCSVCGWTFCQEHGEDCGACQAPICQDDSRSCDYGAHGKTVRFCPKCIRLSFEDKPICQACAQTCARCGHAFPADLIGVCRACSANVCMGHSARADGAKCGECGECVCREHGLDTHDNAWVCRDHAETSSCCGRTYGKSRLVACVDDPEERLCVEHRIACTVCGQPVCKDHVQYTAGGEPLCGNDRRTCARCAEQGRKATHRRSDIIACAICGVDVCAKDRSRCPICGRSEVCLSHQAELGSCRACGSWSCRVRGCHEANQSCTQCSMAYCRKCVSNGICTACSSLAEIAFSDTIARLLAALAPHSDERIRKAAALMAGAQGSCKFRYAANKSYCTWSMQYHPGTFARLFRKAVGLRITTGRNDLVPVQCVWEPMSR